MKNNTIHILCSMALMVLVSGCSFTPYQDDFSCNKGVGEGACASVTESYKASMKLNRNNHVIKDNVHQSYSAIPYSSIEDIESFCKLKLSSLEPVLDSTGSDNKMSTYDDYDECFKGELTGMIQSANLLNKERVRELKDLLYHQNLRMERFKQREELRGEQYDN